MTCLQQAGVYMILVATIGALLSYLYGFIEAALVDWRAHRKEKRAKS